jgi:hypothetical protein
MAKASSDKHLSDEFTGKARKVAMVIEYMAESPNAPSNAIGNATGADAAVVSNTRKLIRRAAGNLHSASADGDLLAISRRG